MSDTKAVHLAAPSSRRRAKPALNVAAFLLMGLLETLIAYVLFQRADDHAYFLAIANEGASAIVESGVEQYDLKAQAVSLVFYTLMSPARWLGAGEIGYLLWLRLLTLIGFLCAFESVRAMLRPGLPKPTARRDRQNFMLVCLLYPGQLAWTASLLRDGPACAFLFAAMLAWSKQQRITAFVLIALSLSLRPEFALVVVILFVARFVVLRWHSLKRRRLMILGACGLLSIALFAPRQAASEFAQFAFADDGAAYPVVQHAFDLGGYLLVLAQSMVDPLSIAAPTTLTLFGLLESAFFFWLLGSSLRRLPRVDGNAAGLYAALFISMWLFAYFEIFVSGYSRHRLALVVLMIAATALTRPRMSRHSLRRLAPPPNILTSDAGDVAAVPRA